MPDTFDNYKELYQVVDDGYTKVSMGGLKDREN